MNRIVFIILLAIIALVSCKPEKHFEKVEFPIEEFTITSITDTTLFCKQGTRIFIGAESFQFPDGTLVTDSVRIQVMEFYQKPDIILAALSTASNGIILETGGMINIKAFSKGIELAIRPEKRIVVHFPKEQNSYKKMDLFYADGNSTDTSVTNWNVDTINLIKRTMKLGSFGWWYPSVNDSTEYDFTPKNFVDTGYYWNPLDFYIKSYHFSTETIKEIERTKNYNSYPRFESWNDYGVECEMYISTNGYIKSPKIRTNLSSGAKKEILKFLKELPQLEPGKINMEKLLKGEACCLFNLET